MSPTTQTLAVAAVATALPVAPLYLLAPELAARWLTLCAVFGLATTLLPQASANEKEN